MPTGRGTVPLQLVVAIGLASCGGAPRPRTVVLDAPRCAVSVEDVEQADRVVPNGSRYMVPLVPGFDYMRGAPYMVHECGATFEWVELAPTVRGARLQGFTGRSATEIETFLMRQGAAREPTSDGTVRYRIEDRVLVFRQLPNGYAVVGGSIAVATAEAIVNAIELAQVGAFDPVALTGVSMTAPAGLSVHDGSVGGAVTYLRDLARPEDEARQVSLALTFVRDRDDGPEGEPVAMEARVGLARERAAQRFAVDAHEWIEEAAVVTEGRARRLGRGLRDDDVPLGVFLGFVDDAHGYYEVLGVFPLAERARWQPRFEEAFASLTLAD